MKTRLLFVLLLALLFGPSLDARHILGGEVTYECLDVNLLQVRLRIYRDCSSSGANFDDPAVISIYRQNGADYELVRTDAAPPVDIESYFPEVDACTILPTDYCVQKGDYFTTLLIEPTGSGQRYVVVYQRCCRSNEVQNVQLPEETGLTLSLELGPEVYEPCIDGPAFDDLPPAVACVNQPLALDFSATDPDGDELRYFFCTPRAGGARGGSPERPGDARACDGVAPNPACPPPFDTVRYLGSLYSGSAPLGGDPKIRVDAQTGIVSGTPPFAGTFNYGLCVEKYRNGNLVFTLRRDFQLTVTDCGGNLPQFDPPAESRGDTLVFNTCGDLELRFDIENIEAGDAGENLWEVDVMGDGNFVPTTARSPTNTYAGPGIYAGRLSFYGGLACERVYPLRINTTACNPTSTDQPEEMPLRIFPNPTRDWLWLEWDANSGRAELALEVYDARGRLQQQLRVRESRYGLDTRDWGPGLYWLRYRVGEQDWQTQRFVVIR